MTNRDAPPDLSEARRLLDLASSPKSSPSQRLSFHKFLLGLASTSSFEHKAFFARHVPRYFAEFEDIQDQAIDGLLDLCEDEDERVRMEGIKGLGETGRVEPRWVKGNAGVLLQLLASPPKELELVHSALSTLLDIAPADLFEVIVDDCKAAEGETGASRRQILSYLSSQSRNIGQRLKRLDRNTAAQRSIQTGLSGVLSLCSAAEKRIVCDLILELPALNGRDSKEAASEELLRSLRGAVKSNDPEDIKLLAHVLLDLDNRRANLDIRWYLACLAKHGEQLVGLAWEEKDGDALKVVHALDDWVYDALKLWARNRGPSAVRELDEKTLVPDTAQALIAGLLEFYRSRSISETLHPEKALYTTERVMLAVYQLLTREKDTRWILSGRQQNSFRNMSKDATREKERFERGSRAREALRNVSDAALILSDVKERIDNITPTKAPKPKAQPEPSPTAVKIVRPQVEAKELPAKKVDVPPSPPATVATARPGVVGSHDRNVQSAGLSSSVEQHNRIPTAPSIDRTPEISAPPPSSQSLRSSNGYVGKELFPGKVYTDDPAVALSAPRAVHDAPPPPIPATTAAPAPPTPRGLSIMGRAKDGQVLTPSLTPTAPQPVQPIAAPSLADRLGLANGQRNLPAGSATSSPITGSGLQSRLNIRNASNTTQVAPEIASPSSADRSLLSRLAVHGSHGSAGTSAGLANRSVTPTSTAPPFGMSIRNGAEGRSKLGTPPDNNQASIAAPRNQGVELLPSPGGKRSRGLGDRVEQPSAKRVARDSPAGRAGGSAPPSAGSLADRIAARR